MKELTEKKKNFNRRKLRTRSRLVGLRLSVFRSHKYIWAQIIDDVTGKTLVSASTKEVKDKKNTKTVSANQVGKIIAIKAKEKGIKSVAFDRGAYKYHGRIKAVADGAREEGILP